MPSLARKPALDRRQRVGTHAHQAPLPLDPAFNQAGALQDLQMPRDRRPADRKGRRDLADAEFARGQQPLDDCAPSWISECREDIVELWGARGHSEALLFYIFVN
jgi:hypothetical protein